MNWFYASHGQRAGPVDDARFSRLVADGTVGDATLVWHVGMAEWTPYARARTSVTPTPIYGGTLADATPDVRAAGGTQTRCSQCGRLFLPDEVLRLSGFDVCAECKPTLLQRLRQGLAPAVTWWGVRPARFGGFWIRWGAVLLDGLILFPVLLAFIMARAHFAPRSGFYPGSPSVLPAVWFQLGYYAVLAAYEIGFVGSFAATPGKLLCGLQVVRSDGSRLTYGRATGRFFGRFLSRFTLFLGYLMAPADPEKRTLHDLVCDTRVVYKE